MRIYRQSIWKDRDKRIQFVIGILIGIPLLVGLVNPHTILSAFWVSGLVSSILFLLLAIGYFYVQTDYEKIELKNCFYLFWNKSYLYQDISKAEFGYVFDVRSQYIYLQIYTSKSKSQKYTINLVSDEDVLRLIEELKSHGVRVTTTQEFDGYYAAIEQRQREKAQGESLRRKAREYEEACRREREKMRR